MFGYCSLGCIIHHSKKNSFEGSLSILLQLHRPCPLHAPTTKTQNHTHTQTNLLSCVCIKLRVQYAVWETSVSACECRCSEIAMHANCRCKRQVYKNWQQIPFAEISTGTFQNNILSTKKKKQKSNYKSMSTISFSQSQCYFVLGGGRTCTPIKVWHTYIHTRINAVELQIALF